MRQGAPSTGYWTSSEEETWMTSPAQTIWRRLSQSRMLPRQAAPDQPQHCQCIRRASSARAHGRRGEHRVPGDQSVDVSSASRVLRGGIVAISALMSASWRSPSPFVSRTVRTTRRRLAASSCPSRNSEFTSSEASKRPSIAAYGASRGVALYASRQPFMLDVSSEHETVRTLSGQARAVGCSGVRATGEATGVFSPVVPITRTTGWEDACVALISWSIAGVRAWLGFRRIRV